MSDAFFLPVGRDVIVNCIGNITYNGELKGIINYGGIPAIWVEKTEDDGTITDHILLINNVVALNINKKNTNKILDGGLIL